MAGLDPAIHVFFVDPKNVDARDKPGHDESLYGDLLRSHHLQAAN